MPQTVQSMRIFTASSGDVSAERVAVKQVITELDHRYDRWGLNLQSVNWETDTIPDFGIDPQEVVNRQIRFDFIDIFVGIVWSRIGTPTYRALSGTVEELNRALASRQQVGRPWAIMFYLCDRPAAVTSPADPVQLEEARKFKEWIERNALSRHYNEAQEFKDLFRTSLSMAIDEFLRNQSVRQLPAMPSPRPLFVQPVSPLLLSVACPWCGPLTTMFMAVYQQHRGQVWPCPRCAMPQFFS